MINPWVNILANLSLSKTEREVVKRYETDPAGRAFLPLADILRSHKLIDESLELMMQGVANHPGFTVARVVLARELLNKGLVEEAWHTIEDSPISLRENVLAQKLRFKLAILISAETMAASTYQHMRLQHMLDAETIKLGDIFSSAGILAAKRYLVKDFEERGCSLILPKEEPHIKQQPPKKPLLEHQTITREKEEKSIDDVTPFKIKPEGLTPKHVDIVRQDSSSFHVVPLEDILNPHGESLVGDGRKKSAGIELDSTTLADIYAHQGHYSKALSIYRRLLRKSPQNDMLRLKVAELAKQARDQKADDLTIDPAIVDQMEQIEIIDAEIKFFNELLSKLEKE